MDPVISEYYRACRIKQQPVTHFINRVKGGINIVFTKKQVELLFNEVEGYYKVREVVVGAEDTPTMGCAIIF